MTSKERVQAVLHGEIPDRVPMMEFLYNRDLYEEVIGRRPEFYNPEDVFDCAHALGLDVCAMPVGGFSGIRSAGSGAKEFQDEWQITFRRDESVSWPGDIPIAYPLQNREDWKNYELPRVDKPGRMKPVEEAVARARELDMAAFGTVRGPFTPTWMLFGFEQFSLLLYDDPGLIREVMGAVTDFYLEAGRMVAACGVDAVLFADDYGSSFGPLISPEQYREFVIPELHRLVGSLKAAGARVVMHSDGDLRKLLPDIVKTGIDGYHPLERAAGMDIQEVKQEYDGRLVVIGNVDNKGALVHGTPEDVVEETKNCLREASPGGGHILAADHSVHEDMPVRNIIAMIETGHRYGAYPLAID